MASRDPRIDAYIERSADFAKPILTHLRDVIHAACPEVEETMKWSMPHFMYNGMLCGMSAFKAHCAFGFWKGSLIEGLQPRKSEGGAAMGHLGCIESVKGLPSKKVLTGYIKEAMRLNDEGITAPKKKKAPKPAAKVPPELAGALAKNKQAAAAFEAFSPSHRREYIEWIDEAKREETRAKRVAQAIEWLAEGKARNWKYEKC